MPGLFISYRREDAAPYAGRLYDHIKRTFPRSKVFIDIDAIDPGEDFIISISNTLSSSEVVLAVIGPAWEKVVDSAGKRRLDNPDDYVVRELSAALQSEARVIPVLVGGASMPRSNALPEHLQSLTRRQAIEISDTRFATDVDRLCSAISRAFDRHKSGPTRTANSISPHSAVDFNDSLMIFKALLWTNFALAAASMLWGVLFIKTELSQNTLLVVGVVVLAIATWFNIMLLRGRNWARLAFAVLFIISIPTLFIDWNERTAVQLTLDAVFTVLSIWLIRLMFTEPLRRLFLTSDSIVKR